MYKNYLETYQDRGEVKLDFDQWCTQKGGGLCESDLAKAEEAYSKYSEDFDIRAIQFNQDDSNLDPNSVKFNNTLREEERQFNAPNQIMGQNFRMSNPYLLSSVGDNPFLDFIGAVGESIQYWRDNDLSKQAKPPYPIDPTGKFLINAELQKQFPNDPTKFMQTPDEYDEWLIQRELDYRAEMYPELYQKEKVDLEEYRKTGKRNFKKKRQTMKLGDRLEMFEYPDAQYINYDEEGNPISYFKEVDGEMQEFPISLKGITEPISLESIPMDPIIYYPTSFPDFELEPPAPYDMTAFYGAPRFDIVAEEAGIDSDFSSYDDDELIEERYGGILHKAQDGDDFDADADPFEDVDLTEDASDMDNYEFDTAEGTYEEGMYNFNPDFDMDVEEDDSDNIEYYDPQEEDPEDSMFDGTTDDVELERDGDAVYTVSPDDDADFDRMTREDKRAIRKANRSGSFGQKVINTLDKIGTTAVTLAKPITNYFRDRAERKRRQQLGLGYLADNVFAPTDADLSGSKGDYDVNTGIFRPDDKVISRLGRYGFELPYLQEGNGEEEEVTSDSSSSDFIANRYEGFDDLTEDEQNQVLNQFSGTNTTSDGNNYSDQYNETMAYKDENRTVGYNPAISELPDWLKAPNEGFGRIIVDDEMARRMRGQLASGNLDPDVAEGYYRFLEGYRGPAAIDYDIDKGSGFGYKDDLPGRGPFDTVYGNYDEDVIESLLALSDRVNESRYPNLDQEAIDAENERDFNRMVSREAYNIRKEEQAEADEYFKNLKLKEIEEDPEEEEDIVYLNQQAPVRSPSTPYMLDEVLLTDTMAPIQGGMLNEIVLNAKRDNNEAAATIVPRTVDSVGGNNQETIIRQSAPGSIQSRPPAPSRQVVEEDEEVVTTPNSEQNSIPVVEQNTTSSTSDSQEYTPQSVSREEYIPQSQRNDEEYTPQSQRDDEEYTPQSQRDDEEYEPQSQALYGGSFYGTGGEAEIDINTYKALIAAGADIEIL